MAQPSDPHLTGETLVVTAGSSTPTGFKHVQFLNSSGTELFSVDTTGAVNQEGGLAAVNAARKVNWANEWNPRATTDGTNATPTAGTIYVSAVWIPATVVLTGISVFNGSAVGTDKAIVALYSSAGVKLANSALAGTTCSGTDAMQAIAFTATYTAKGPDLYYLSWSCDGTTARLNTQNAPGVGYTTSQAGVFGTLDAITTPPTTFTADVGPIAATY